MKKGLTSPSFWDSQWKKERGYRLGEALQSNRETDEFLKLHLLDVPSKARLLELGGAPGAMATRHHRARPDIEIHCVDFSETGLQVTRKRFEANRIEGDVHFADFRSWAEGHGRFDVVTSYGLVEHFDNFEEIITLHFSYCRPGGKVIITVPNYSTQPVRWFLNHCSEKTIATHNLNCMSEPALAESVARNTGIYETGQFGLARLPHSHYDATLAGRTYHAASTLWNGCISLLAFVTGFRVNVRFWSSHIFVVARKEKT